MAKKMTKKIKELSISQILKELDKLIIDGINIGRKTYTTALPNDTRDEYISWTFSLKDLLNREFITKKIDIGYLYDPKSIPPTLGGIEYGDKNSKESKELDEKIVKEIRELLKFLRKKKEEIKILSETKNNKIIRKAKKIESIILAKPKNKKSEKYILIINGIKRSTINTRGEYWKNFIEIKKTDFINFNKLIYDYFNNRKQNPIYSRTNLELTKILDISSGHHLKINDEIKYEIISHSTYKRRLNQGTIKQKTNA